MSEATPIRPQPPEQDTALIIMALIERLRAEVANYRGEPHDVGETDWLDRLDAALGFITGHHGALFSYLESVGKFLLEDPGNDIEKVTEAIAWLLEDERGNTPDVEWESDDRGITFRVSGATVTDGRIVPATRVVTATAYAVVSQTVDLEVPVDADDDAIAELVREETSWYHTVEDDDPVDWPIEVLY